MDPMRDLPTDDSVSLDESSDQSDDGSSDESKGRQAVEPSTRAAGDSSDDYSSDSHDATNDIDQQNKVGSDSDDSKEPNTEEAPLEERLQQQRDVGRSPRVRRHIYERKKQALKVAAERLFALQQTKDEASASTVVETLKKSKHAPAEVSSRRSAHWKAQSLNSAGVGVELNAHRYKPRDPRLSSMSGHFQQDHFERNYAFLQDVRDQEMESLKRRIAARKTSGRKGQKLRRKLGLTNNGSLEEDHAELRRLQQEKASFERSQVERAAKRAVKRKIKDDVVSGKSGVYYLKRREQKRLELEAKFEELRKRGGDKAVERAMAKRRKKNKSKDTGFMPKDV